MSLLKIREMRLAGRKPQGIVTIIIGPAPKCCSGDSLVIEVKASAQPAFMDWRPLVGCWVAIYNLAGAEPLMTACVDALDKAGAKLFGFVHQGVGHPLAIFEKPEQKQKAAYFMCRQWEWLCQ